MNFEIGKSWGKKLQGRVEKFNFEIGILDDGPHYEPKVPQGLYSEPLLKSYAGGPARQQSNMKSEKTTGEIFVENMKRLNINFLTRPFQDKNDDLFRFMQAFLKLVVQRPGISMKRVENLLQAVVRNPILKQEYGQNSAKTADAKGFNRNLIDTAQMFKSIKARAKRV